MYCATMDGQPVLQLQDTGSYTYAYKTISMVGGGSYTVSGDHLLEAYGYDCDVDSWSQGRPRVHLWCTPAIVICYGAHISDWYSIANTGSNCFFSSNPGTQMGWSSFSHTFTSASGEATIYLTQNGGGGTSSYFQAFAAN